MAGPAAGCGPGVRETVPKCCRLRLGPRVVADSRSVVRLALGAVLLLQCGGCLVGPDFSAPSAPVADKWLEANNPSVKSVLPVASGRREDWEWWTVFHDPVLDRLIRIAYEHNLN